MIVAGWSTDGDPKLLSAMCNQTIHNPNMDVKFVQDMIHIAVKLRNRLLSSIVNLSIGNKSVKVKHLKDLVKNVNKSIHGLNASEVAPTDRQNFTSFQKILQDRVIIALEQNENDSEGTVKYLQLCKDITSSYLEYDLTPLERILRMFRAVYFLRLWRNHIIISRNRRLNENFISSNAYTGIELNARNMIALIKKFRNENIPQCFLLTMFDSQTCEKAFRQLRSMGTMNYTRINFNSYDILHMIGRIEVQNDIAYFKLADVDVLFPLSHKKSNKTKIYDLPSDEEIDSMLERAKLEAIEDAQKFGIEQCSVDALESSLFLSVDQNECDDEVDNDEGDNDLDGDFQNVPDVPFDDEEDNDNQLEADSAFTTVTDEDGQQRVIRKSTFVWLLTEPGSVVSKDRLRRVQVSKKRQFPQE